MSTPLPIILHIAIYKPVRHCFDYLLPLSQSTSVHLKPGVRVQVFFGRQQVIGVLIAINQSPCISLELIKPAVAILDEEALISPAIMSLYQWASRYYQHPIGEVILGTLPSLLRNDAALAKQPIMVYRTLELPGTLANLKRSPKRQALLQLLMGTPTGLTFAEIKTAGFTRAILNSLIGQGWVEEQNLGSWSIVAPYSRTFLPVEKVVAETFLALNHDQQHAVTRMVACQGFHTFLLHGVTGSGKTEVYFHIIAQQLKAGRQALVLVPEIGLTPQAISRFAQRFSVPIVALHSKLTPRERLDAWLRAKKGEVSIIIGTRSAIFTPLAYPGVIIVDEEHDQSFKQQSGFRYCARDLAIFRGRLENIPVVLGSATPSLESLHNAHTGRFDLLSLPERAGKAIQPTFFLVDLRNQYLEEGLSQPLLAAIQQHLINQNQILLFLNRRGYAPVLLCHECGWTAACQRCDAKLTLHHQPIRLICHHCTSCHSLPVQCGHCQGAQLFSIGVGTERLEQALQRHFPNISILRIDRDTVKHKDSMEKMLINVHSGQPQILLGTQMLAKGHHFPNVTLVGIINVDGGLYSSDFRACEQLGQLILQVAGRAGRAEKPGEVYLQTHHPNHPLLQSLVYKGYNDFAALLLRERQAAHWPPFTHLALLRAEATKKTVALAFLTQVRQLAEQRNQHSSIQLLGPVPACMERKAGYFRALLLIQAIHRPVLQEWLTGFVMKLEKLKVGRKVRWSLDIDPRDISS